VAENACELLSEAVDQHNAARERIAQLVAELHERQAELRAAYTSAQRIYTTCGRGTLSHHLHGTPTVEAIVVDGGAPALLDRNDLHDDSLALHGMQPDESPHERERNRILAEEKQHRRDKRARFAAQGL
jgi:hypothetical protein